MNVCVIGGAGYVGLITGAGLAEIGHRVINVDVDAEQVRALQAGQSPIYEEGLEPVLKRNLQAGRLVFSTDLPAAVASSEVVFISVGTPSLEDGRADISQVKSVAEQLAGCGGGYKVIAIKSTVPMGAVVLIRSILQGRNEGEGFDLVVNPEFLREGKGLYDFFYPERIVIGATSARAKEVMRTLYAPIIQRQVALGEGPERRLSPGPVPMVETDIASAHMIKYASNAFLATRISFINEIASLCEKVGADVREVARGMGHDPRIGHAYLQPGLGFGGPCLEKDLLALIRVAEGNGYQPQLLNAVLERNGRQVSLAIEKLKQLVGPSLAGRALAVFGLTFKAGTNDLRNSPALRLLGGLLEQGAIVRAYDPVVPPESLDLGPRCTLWADPYQAARHTHALLITTDWPQIKQLDYQVLRASMADPCIVDTRNLLDPPAMKALGFHYVGIARP